MWEQQLSASQTVQGTFAMSWVLEEAKRMQVEFALQGH
jgi:hypothetical protein